MGNDKKWLFPDRKRDRESERERERGGECVCMFLNILLMKMHSNKFYNESLFTIHPQVLSFPLRIQRIMHSWFWEKDNLPREKNLSLMRSRSWSIFVRPIVHIYSNLRQALFFLRRKLGRFSTCCALSVFYFLSSCKIVIKSHISFIICFTIFDSL